MNSIAMESAGKKPEGILIKALTCTPKIIYALKIEVAIVINFVAMYAPLITQCYKQITV